MVEMCSTVDCLLVTYSQAHRDSREQGVGLLVTTETVVANSIRQAKQQTIGGHYSHTTQVPLGEEICETP